MAKKWISLILAAVAVCCLAGCGGAPKDAGVDICDSAVREYLNAGSKSAQAELLERYSGTNLARQTLSFTWEDAACKVYNVYFADNKNYENARVYQAYVPTLTPDGIFLPGRTYYWKVENSETGDLVKEDQFTVKDAPVRYITTSTVSNMRDMGGWKTKSGKAIKYEMLYRGGITNLGGGNNFNEKDVVLFRDTLGIKTEIDLRTPNADDGGQTVSILGENASYYKTPIHGYCNIIPGFHQSSPVERSYSSDITRSIRQIFRLLADESNYPVYIHCNAGADRTGTIAYLIGGVLGMSYEDLTRDFEITSFSQAGRRWRSGIENGVFDDTGVMQDDQENYVAWGKMHQMMLENYEGDNLQESIENYLTTVCRVPQEDIDSLRAIMLED